MGSQGRSVTRSVSIRYAGGVPGPALSSSVVGDMREVFDDQREDEEVEGVEGPAEKTGQHGVAPAARVYRRPRFHASGSIPSL